MRLIKSGKTVMGVRASNVARIYFSQEFGAELDKRMMEDLKPDSDRDRMTETLYRIIWAMWKADVYYEKKPMLDYETWLGWITDNKFDINDCIDNVMDEIESGFAVKPEAGKTSTASDISNLAYKTRAVALKMGMSLDELNELTTQA